ncbi:hypothetical protein HY374_03895 [Candidatus Berkelbacteria bacterium]|nr:hypothetical protein [Candidatus Berkelbacteria bacterium]
MTRALVRLILSVLALFGAAVITAERADAVQFGNRPSGNGLIVCWIGNWKVNECPPPPEPRCEEVLELSITSVYNGNRLESSTFSGSEAGTRHPIAAGARYNSGTGHWEDPNNPNNYVTFAPRIRFVHKTCAGHDPQFTTQEISHNTLPVDAGHSVDVVVTQTCENCNKRRLTSLLPVDTVASAAPPAPIQPPPPVLIGPPVVPKPTPVALSAVPKCLDSRPGVVLSWFGGQGASTINVWRGGPDAGSHGGWEKVHSLNVQGPHPLTRGVTIQTFADTAVSAGQSYQYSIEALSANGTQTLSPNVAVTVPSCTPPAASFTLTVTTTCTKANQRSATLSWQPVPGVTSYSVITRDKGVDPGYTLPVTLGPGVTSTTLSMRADTTWQVYAFTPAGVSKSNEVTLALETCAPATIPATIEALGTAQFTVTGLPVGGAWDRLEFPGLALNGGRVIVGIASVTDPCDPSASCAPSTTFSTIDVTDAKPAVNLTELTGLDQYRSFVLTLTLHANPGQTATPRVPKILVSARPPKATPAPIVDLSSTVSNETAQILLRNSGPGSIELVNTAPFVINTLGGEAVYAPTAAQQVTSLSAGQTKSWTWDFRRSDDTTAAAGTYVVKLTYRLGSEERSIETQVVRAESGTTEPIKTVTEPPSPAPSILTIDPLTGTTPLTISTTFGSSASSNGAKFAIRYNDGSTEESYVPGQTVKHTFTKAGTYTVEIINKDVTCLAIGCDIAASTLVTVNDVSTEPPPTSGTTLSVTPTSGAAPLTVSVTVPRFGVSINFSHELDWGDGSTRESLGTGGKTLTHTYASAGTYTVKLLKNFFTTSTVSQATVTVTPPETTPPPPPEVLSSEPTAIGSGADTGSTGTEPTPGSTPPTASTTSGTPAAITQGLGELPPAGTTATETPANPGGSTTSGEPSTPTAPGNLSGTAQSRTAIKLAWQDNADDETGYVVERRLTTCKIKRIRIVRWRFRTERTCPEFSAVTTLDANATSYIDTKLRRNTLYEYRVMATNAAGESAPSNAIKIRTKR